MFQFVPTDSIRWDDEARQRSRLDIKDLIGSIKARGIINPIVVGEGGVGVAGRRRWQCAKELGLETVPIRLYSNLSAVERQIIELEENIRRSDLAWQDEVRAFERIHRLYKSLDPSWTQQRTAEALFVREDRLSTYLHVAEVLGDERIAGASNLREAFNVLSRIEERREANRQAEILVTVAEMAGGPEAPEGSTTISRAEAELAELLDGRPRLATAMTPTFAVPALPPSEILQADFHEWIRTYEGRKFNLIHCDFPFGIEHGSGEQARGNEVEVYEDSLEIYQRLVLALCHYKDRLISHSAHMIFWFSNKNLAWTMEQFKTGLPEFEFSTHPLVWLKSDNAGISPDPRHNPRHVYETALFGTKGSRPIIHTVADAVAKPTDKRYHASTKPESVLAHFFRMVVDEQTIMLDPTAGSGSAVRVADAMGAAATLGLEIDPTNAEIAQRALRAARTLRAASKMVEGRET